jgi:hypothetical protein
MTKFILKTGIIIFIIAFTIGCLAFMGLVSFGIYYGNQGMYNVTAVSFQWAAYVAGTCIALALLTLYAQRLNNRLI